MTEARTTLRVVLPAVAMIAVTFGLARYGYGLLLPEMRAELGVDSRTGGLIAAGASVTYLAGNTVVVWLTSRFGPRLPLALATLTAALGMAAIASADGPGGLAGGVLLAGTAAGLAFPPYADIVANQIPAGQQAVSWSVISSGTGWGIALAGPVAIAFGERWRLAWLAFAAVAVIAGVAATVAAPARRADTGESPARLSWASLVTPRSRPLLASSVLVGVGSSVWWAFSVDALRAAGLTETPARGAYALCGAAGVLASATGVVSNRVGLRRCYLAVCVALAAATATFGIAPPQLGAVLVAATVFGIAYNAVIAAQGLWNAVVFSERPSAGLAAVNVALTIGMITGPAVAGFAIQSHGYVVTFLGAGAVVALAALTAPPAEPCDA